MAEEEGVPWELLYNLGTALMQRGNEDDLANAERFLIRAEEACREVVFAQGERQLGMFFGTVVPRARWIFERLSIG